MTQDEIIRMARELATRHGSRMCDEDGETHGEELYCVGVDDVVEIIKQVAAHERKKQAEKEPLMDYERINALREGEQNGAEDAYFFVRPENDTPSLRKMFCQGFERGFHKGLKYASHVRTKDLTDDEIEAIVDSVGAHEVGYWQHVFARAVIAADREKNK